MYTKIQRDRLQIGSHCLTVVLQQWIDAGEKDGARVKKVAGHGGT